MYAYKKGILGRGGITKNARNPNHQVGEGSSLTPVRSGSDWSTGGGTKAGMRESRGGEGACNLGVRGCRIELKRV